MRHAQRKHFIQSLDALIYQLHTLSFFLSPSIWPYLSRVLSQFHFSRPRVLDPKRSIRFWFFLVLFFNVGSVWSHATEATQQGRSVVLDFVGMSFKPSRPYMLVLDAIIIFFQLLLTSIAYEASLAADMPADALDPLLPAPSESPASSTPFLTDFDESKPSSREESPYIIDLRLSPIIHRLRQPVPTVPTREPPSTLLPLPNTTPWQLPGSLQLFMQARARMRDRARARTTQGRAGSPNNEEDRRRIPGGLDTADGT